MTSFNAPAKLSRQILMLTAGIFLLTATQGALAKNKDHSDDQGGMSSNGSKQDHGDKHSEDHKNHKGNDKKYAEEGMNSEKHKGKDKKYTEKTKDKDRHKTPGSAASNNPPAPGTDGTNRIHPIPSPAPVASSSGAPGDVTPPVNTIHPIPSPAPVASSSGAPGDVNPPVNTIVRDHRHPPAGTAAPQSGVKPDGYTGFEDSTAGGHFFKGLSDFADGLTHGFGAGPAPEDPTSTSTQY